MTRRLVFWIKPVVAADGSTAEFLFSTDHWTTKPTDTPPNKPAAGTLLATGSYTRKLFGGARVTGAVVPSHGAIEIANSAPSSSAGTALDAWADYGIAGAECGLRWGDVDAAYPGGYVDVWVARAAAWRLTTDKMVIQLRDQLSLLDAPVVTDGFAGSGGLEGNGAVAKRKQWVSGDAGFIEPILVDAVKQIYFVQSTGTGGLHDAWKVNPGAEVNPFDTFVNGVEVTRDSANYASADELLASAPAPGYVKFWFGSDSATAPGAKNGPVYLRLGSPAGGDVRVFAYGAPTDTDAALRGGTAYGSYFAGSLALRAGVALADLSASADTLPVINLLVDDDRSYSDALADAALTLQGWFGFSRLGKFQSGLLLDPESTHPYYGITPGVITSTPAADSVSLYTFTERHMGTQLQRDPVPGMEVPVWTVAFTAGDTQPSQVAGGASAQMRDYLTRKVWASGSGSAPATRLKHPGAAAATVKMRSRVIQTAFSQRVWLERYMALYGGLRHFFTFTTPMTDELLQLDLHDCVTLQHRMYGLAAGKKCRIVAMTIEPSATGGRIQWTLWTGETGRYVPGVSSLPPGSGGGAAFVPPAVERDRAASVGGLGYGRMSMAGRGGVASIGVVGGSGRASESAGGGATDPHFSDVLLLMHFDGSNGSTSFVDSSSYARSFTAYGDAQISTTGALFGQCGYFEGTSIDYASTTDLSGFGSLVGASYTIELAFSRPSFPSGGSATELLLLVTGPGQPQLVEIGVTDYGAISVVVEGVALFDEAITVGAWRRIAVTYDHVSDLARLYVDGTRVATAGGSGGISTTAHLLLVGGHWTGFGGSVDTRMDELRITPVARYTGASYTLDTAPFPDS